MARLKFAVVCSSNQNRSMEAHAALKGANMLARARAVQRSAAQRGARPSPAAAAAAPRPPAAPPAGAARPPLCA